MTEYDRRRGDDSATRAPDRRLGDSPEQRLAQLPRPLLGALLRVARRIQEGFEGEITICITQGGVRFVRWTHTETGEVLKAEIG